MSEMDILPSLWWQAQLARDQIPLSLPLSRVRSKVYSGLRAEIEPIGLRKGTDLASLIAATAAWLNRCHGLNQVTLGKAEDGLLSVVTLTVDSSERLEDLETRARESRVLEIAAPYELAEALAAKRANGNPLFSILISDGSDLPDLRSDVALTMRDETLRVRYARRLIAQESIESFTGYIARHLAAAGRALSDVPLVSDAEHAALLAEGQGEIINYGTGRVETLVAAIAEAMPDAPALIDKNQSWSYTKLMTEARQIAGLLQREGIAPGDKVGLAMPPSGKTIAALLGILIAGGTVLAIDPDFPVARNAICMEDAGCAAVVTLSCTEGGLPEGIHRIELDRSAPAPPMVGPIRSSAEDAVYVIFTSGSTGRPKGVAMPHKALWNLIKWQAARGDAPHGRRTLHRSSIGFDVGFQEIFATLGFGGTLVIADADDRADVSRLPRLVKDGKIHRLFLPPVALHQLAESVDGSHDLSALKEIFVSGERLKVTPALVRFFRQVDCLLDNQYGPTETHVCTGVILPQDSTRWPPLPPLGGPVANTRLYVLSEAGELLPRGVPGELWIGGVTMSLGYLKPREEDAERYREDPFLPGARVYRSGDLVRWNAPGLLDYIGRIDRQVKLRGYRIELGEIEAAMLAAPGVAEAVAVTRVDAAGETRLLTYYRRIKGVEVTPLTLRTVLEDRLPAHMVPAAGAIMEVERFPLTATGKVHAASLPEPEGRRPELSSGFAASCGTLETDITRAWEEELGINGIGRDDDFMELGGDSFKAIRLVARVNELFDKRVPLRVLLNGGTVARHAEEVTRRCGDAEEEAELQELEEVEVKPDVTILAPQRQEALYLHRDIDAGSYEQNGVRLPTNGWVVDVGAHVGLFALRVLAESADVRMLCVEPMPILAEALRQNLACYGERVVHEAAAAWSVSGVRTGTYYPRLSGMSSLLDRRAEDEALLSQIVSNLAAFDGAELGGDEIASLVEERTAFAQEVSVPVKRLDAILDEHRIESVALLKIDVQGGEEEVLSGMDTAAWDKVGSVAVEVQDLGGAASRTKDLLAARGFQVAEAQADFHIGAPVRYIHGTR